MIKINKILLSPHNDDETLFAAYIILREKPLVVIATDGYAQMERSHKEITPELRKNETLCAMKILGAEVEFFGIRDTLINHESLKRKLATFNPEIVYAPYPNSVHEQHNLVGNMAYELYGNRVKFYATYTKQEVYNIETLAPKGDIEIKPTKEEMELKNQALDCYKSQIRLCNEHFIAVRNKSEYLCLK